MASQFAPVIAAGIGAAAALLGQGFTWKATERRLRAELAQRQRESALRYLEPLRDKQIECYETFHELLQDVIEQQVLSEGSYIRVRPLFVYLGDDLRSRVVTVLSRVVQTTRLDDTDRSEILEVQHIIRTKLQPPDPPSLT